MFLEMDNWHSGYAQILTDCRRRRSGGDNTGSSGAGSAGGSVLILCNADADALAAARILSYMLRSDGVAHQLRPCRSGSQLRRACGAIATTTHADASTADSSDETAAAVRAIVLLNLGANQNLAKMLFEGTDSSTAPPAAQEEEQEEDANDESNNNNHHESSQQQLLPLDTKVYVMDCRRPVHLANLYDERNIVVFWGDHAQQQDGGAVDLPSDGDNLSGDESSSSSSSDDDDDDDDDDSSDDEDGDNQEREFEMDDDEGEGGEFGREQQTAAEEQAKQQEDQEELPDESMMLDVGQEQDTDYDGEDEKDQDDGDHHHRDRAAPPPSSSTKKSRDNNAALDETAITEATTQDHDDDDDRDEEEEQDPQLRPTMTPREIHRDRRLRLQKYYATGSYYGTPAAFVAHAIATQLRFRAIGDLLWLACVGVTDAYLHARLDLSGYSQLVIRLRELCHSLFPGDDEFSRVSRAVYAETLLGGGSSSGDNSGNNDHHHLTRIAFSGNGRILAETDFRFFLLRHTSLYDAMLHSDYVSTRLQLPTAKGLHKLQEMLAQMGFPLEECRQPFAFMKPSLRRQLKDRLQEQKEDYGLENFEFTSFFRITGYQSLLSASDTSYAVTALLECDDEPSSTLVDDDPDERLLQSFHAAYDALNSNQAAPAVSLTALGGDGSSLANLVNGGTLASSSSGGLGAGLRLAMKLQKSIMRTAAGLMDRNAITRLSHFRYAYITCTSQGGEYGTTTGAGGGADENRMIIGNKDGPHDETTTTTTDHVFAKPLALTRLAHYLMDWNRENYKWTGRLARPLVLLAEKPRTDSFLIVGYEYPESAGDLVRNQFGRHFETVATSIMGTFVFDSFDSNVVEVARPDAQRFMEQLHYLMETHSRL